METNDTRPTPLRVALLAASTALLVAVFVALACGPAQDGQGATPTPEPTATVEATAEPAPTPTIAYPENVKLLPGDSDVDGDGIWDYEAIDVDTGEVLRFDIYPSAGIVRGAYPQGDYRSDLGELFRTSTVLKIRSTGWRFIRAVSNDDYRDFACEVTEVEVLEQLNGEAADVEYYRTGKILLNSRRFNGGQLEDGRRSLVGSTNGVDKGLGVQPGKEYLLVHRDIAGRFAGDEHCPFWRVHKLYRTGMGGPGSLWEIDGEELKDSLAYGGPWDYSITAPELFVEESRGASGASGDSASRNYFGQDGVMRLDFSEVKELFEEDQ
ncbi:MAG: hypothetical protein F4W95_06615 [Chloroflexi bacterium]|nr:hypothetical protein [Chloroflexota bacterium]MYD48142.1 hypothetical protein [Chloroflexota bacterium]